MIRSVRRARPLGLALTLLATASVVLVMPAVPATAAPALNPLECHHAVDGTDFTSGTDVSDLVSCSIVAPSDGKVVLVATASVAYDTADSEALYEVAVDGAVGRNQRWVDVSSAPGDGTDRSVAITALTSVTDGSHTFTMRVRRSAGTGRIATYDPSVWALFIPSGSPYATCAPAVPLDWTATQAAMSTVSSCTLDVTSPSRVLVLGSASAAYSDADYEGRVRVGIDQPQGSTASDRYFDITSAGSDGADRTVATQHSDVVAAGSHTITLNAARQGGTGTVKLYRPSLLAIAVPTSSTGLQVCAGGVDTVWVNPSTTSTSMTACDLTATRAGSALVVGTASAGIGAGGSPYESQFLLTVGGDGAPATDRYVDVVADGGDGDDVAVADSSAVPVGAGTRTVSFLGRVYTTGGPLLTYDPGVAAIFVPQPDLTAPTVTVTSAPTDGTSTSVSAAFTVDADATTTCSLDGAPGQPCAGTYGATGLAVGPHTLTIVATDTVGNQTTRVLSWTVAAPAPATAPTPTPTPTPAPPTALEVRLSGTKVAVNAVLQRVRASKACPRRATVVVRKGRTVLTTTTLPAKAVGAGCRVAGTVKVSPKPAARAKVKVTVSGKNLRSRTIAAVRA
ncbi:hypothetical protein F4692_002660 [Nocardioides cavernae]|uniref:Bacterial Ig-like domain-containing protein n=1 Tax=Nocardioides cavernae TaxID=1921566 RepID=A0A7Y9KTF0_9ACTN|nr:hypothetical protein [Nocardioides cavernae]NYE37527.1 hypothetical protein [Nocardioides cavernae]